MAYGIDTDESSMARADRLGNKKKKPGGGGLLPQVDITPPIQPDWRAGITPIPNASGSASPSPIPNQQGPTQAEALRHQLELRRRRTELGSEQGMLVGTPSTGLDLESKFARAAAIRERGNSIADINTALAPVQTPQTPSQVSSGREDIRKQLALNASIMQQRALDAAKTATTPQQKAMLEDQYRIASEALAKSQTDPAFAPLGLESPRTTQIIQSQRDLQAKQQAARGAAAVEAGADLSREKAGIELQRHLAGQRGELAVAANDAAIAQQAFAGDPQTLKAKLDTERAVAQAGARTAVAGGAAAGRQATLDQFGITPQWLETAHSDIAQIKNSMGSAASGYVAGNAFGGAEAASTAADSFGRRVAQIEQAAALDPTTAAQIAGDLLDALPSVDSAGGYHSGGSGGAALLGVPTASLPVNQRNRQMAAMKLTSIRHRLERLASPGS